MRTGRVELPPDVRSLHLRRLARAAERIRAPREESNDRLSVMPAWQIVESMRQAKRQVAERVMEVMSAVRAFRIKERLVSR
jgi:hypothetical protein